MQLQPNLTFHERVEKGLADSVLRGALERATGRFQTLRAAAFSSLADPEATRDRARQIRAHTLRSLDSYLEEFAENAERAGAQIHFAADAVALNQTVLRISMNNGVRRVVKGKSMISEETELNHALEKQGIRVVETDLGEFIIQLANESPSHIIVPAIHKTKEQVGQLLHERLDIPLYDDPAQMTAAARAALRKEFLEADLGISGVNFGVAESGTICIVTNEGNGRLTTTAPRIHIALMGIERLVPTFDDLSVMLQVLARSATGQKLTVYTNLITGPRRPGEPDGPDELHIILLDNGRSRVLGTQVAEILYCIRCGACLNACPVYRGVGGHAYGSVYTGPVGAVLTPALGGIALWSDLPQASSLCGACREVCPVRIDIPRMLLVQREEAVRAGKQPWWLNLGLKVYALAATHPKLFGIAASAARISSRVLGMPGNGWIRHLPPPLSAWTRSRDMPAFARKPFSSQFREHRASSRSRNGVA